MSDGNIADIADSWGATLRIDVRPGTDDLQVFVLTVQDETTAAITLTAAQVRALTNTLLDAGF